MSDLPEIFRILNDPISVTCRRTSMQACHLCERMECGDNTNPLLKRIKELESQQPRPAESEYVIASRLYQKFNDEIINKVSGERNFLQWCENQTPESGKVEK